MSTQKKYNSFRELKKIQRALAVGGHHTDALELGKKLSPAGVKLAYEYLGVKELPEGPNGTLVREIALEVAGTEQEPSMAVKLRSVLRTAAWSDSTTTTGKLEKAKAALPDLMKTIEALQ
jgi:hypothetical protein